MALRRQPISLPHQVSFERGRPYPARRASDSETPSMTRTSPAWAVARNHSASPPLTAINEHHASQNTHKNPELEYHRRLKAASKRDRHKLAKEDEYAVDRTLAQVAPEHACARCKSQRWRCYIPRDPHSPRRTCLPCGKNKCTFGGSKTRPPTIDSGGAAAVSTAATTNNVNNIKASPMPSTPASAVDVPSAPSPAPSLLSLDTVPPRQRPRPTLPLSLPSRNWGDFYGAKPPLPSLSLPTPQLSPAMTSDGGFGNPNVLPTSPRDSFFLPPVRTGDRELKHERDRRDHHNRDRELPAPRLSVPAPDTSRRMSVPQLLSPPSSSPTSSAPATPAASIVTTPPAESCPRSYTPGAPAPFDVLPPLNCHGARPTAPPAWDLPPATEDLLGLLLECAERFPADPRARRVAEGMMGAARVQWVSAIAAAQARGEARAQRQRVREREAEARRGRCKAELENVHAQMARGFTQAREAMCRAIEIE